MGIEKTGFTRGIGKKLAILLSFRVHRPVLNGAGRKTNKSRGSRSEKGSVIPPLRGEQALETIVLLYVCAVREARIRNESLLTSCCSHVPGLFVIS